MRINRYRQKKKQLNGSRIGRLIGFGATALVIALGTNIRKAFKLTDQFPLIMINDAPPLPPPTIPKKRQLLVSPTDSIFARNDFTSSEFAPIVNEEYRLVFFPTPPSTLFKKLLRRIQGFEDWNDRSPHHVKDNGLKYLWDFDREKASAIMTSKKYKRVIFTRDPKERFYSLYHDVVLRTNGNYVLNKCCPSTRDCLNPVREDTFLKLIQTCRDPQWTPQVDRMEEKYWEYINFVGNWDTIEQDTQTLLQDLGIWNSFGENGWGPWRNQSLAERLAINYQNQQRHALMDEFYNEQLERRVEDAYKRDYDNPKMRFQRSPIVSLNDYIYKKDLDVWDGAPVVVEEYKLLFFTVPKVACTTWKQLFRRIRGVDNWQSQNPEKFLPHNPYHNKLKYLWDYSIQDANHMMTSPDWTRAIFVRDPKERFLSAFMDKALQYPQFIRSKCCKETKDCDKGVKMPLGFLNLIQTCHNDHWSQQHYRVEQKFWPYINFVGNFETQQQDAKRLLQQIGAWDVYGKSGWGKSGDLEIFQKATNTQKHVTNSKSKASQWFTPELERMVETYYEVDYLNPKFNFVTTNLTGGNDSRERNAGYLLKDVFQKLLDQGRSIDFQKLIPK